MKAIMKLGKGPGKIKYVEVEKPEAGDEDLLIEVKAVGICSSDIRLKNLGNSAILIPPVIIGHEFAGEIIEVGKKVKDFKVGERVVSDNEGYICGHCSQCAVGNYMMCEELKTLGFSMNGGFTKYVKIEGKLLKKNPHTLFRIPDKVSFEEASMMDPACNAYKAVIQEGNIIPGENIAIFGIGTIGLLAIQMAKNAGAVNIIAVNRSCNKMKSDLAQKFGATSVLSFEKDDVYEEIKRITNGEGVPLIVDSAGKNEILEHSVKILKKNGRFVKIGYDNEPLNFSFDQFIYRGITIIGHYAYDYSSWKNVMSMLERGFLDFKSIITGRYPLDEWEKGFKEAESRNALKVVLYP